MKENEHNGIDPELISPGDPPYPLDVSALTRGQDIARDECERITGVKQTNEPQFSFALLSLAKWIKAQSAAIGDPLSVCQRRGGIHINTDAEASAYHANNMRNHAHGITSNLSDLCTIVRPDRLNDVQRMAHEQSVKVWALKASAMRRAGRARNIGTDDGNTAIA